MTWRKSSKPDWDEPEAENEDDYPRANAEETVVCAECGAEFHELASMCPHCGCWRTADETRRKRPLWLIIAALVTAAAFVLMYVF